jgi:MoxR-like ATPase
MRDSIDTAIAEISSVLQGKEEAIKQALACFFADGHLLLEDLPGMGKTTLAQAFSKVLGLDFSRVQFTSDMLPADLLGASIFEKESSRFVFHKGPVFTQILLADEINRTTAKTQSALLEAMAERQVTVEGVTEILPEPFFVIATQNPNTQFGTFALPESQLDRFLIKIELGYPSQASERALLKGETGRGLLAGLQAVFTQEQIQAIQNQVKAIHASDSLLDYVQALIAYTRDHAQLQYGISPRGGLALLQMAKAWAYIHHREYVIPEDVQAVVASVFEHRLIHATDSASNALAIIDNMLQDVAVS